MASIWKGSLSFGLVSIPVEMRTAVQEDHISFRQLHEDDLAPIKYDRVSSSSGETVPWNEIVKGYEYEKGKFVIITDEDFKAAAVESSKTLEIVDFVKEDEIDPRFCETPSARPGRSALARSLFARSSTSPASRSSTTRSCSRSCASPMSSSTPTRFTSRTPASFVRRSCRWPSSS